MGNHINQSFKRELKTIIDSKKIWLGIYTILTFINWVIDICGFIFMVIMFGKPGHEYADLLMIFIISCFMAGDIVYIFWALGTYLKLPAEHGKAVLKTFLGLANSMTNKLNSAMDKAKEKAREMRANRN